jgi:hypothetical protein
VRPRRVVRFARLIQRRGRAFGLACGRRRLRRHLMPDRLPLTVVWPSPNGYRTRTPMSVSRQRCPAQGRAAVQDGQIPIYDPA